MKENNVIKIDDVSKNLNVSRQHMNILVERGIINSLKFDNVFYVTLQEYEKIRNMFENDRKSLDKAFENREEIRKRAIEEIADLLG